VIVQWLQDLSDENVLSYGHKAVTLGRLSRAGLPVPEGFVVSGQQFAAHAERCLGPQWWHSELKPTELEFQRFVQTELDPALVAAIDHAYGALGDPAVSVAVRSSSTLEDRSDRSAAGMHESVLGVVGLSAVLAALRQVWLSLWSGPALAYDRHRPASGPPLVAVLVQRLVQADAAGVMFTANPVTGSPEEIVVNSVWGLGAPAMAGELMPDAFVVNRRTGALCSSTVARKPFRLSCAGPDLRRQPLSEDQAGAPSLSPAQLRQLAELARRVEDEALLGCPPCDVEWARQDETFFVVQARPVTSRTPQGGAPNDLWTNANVGEALPGVATPLTWSIALRYSEHGFRRAFAALGCRVPRQAKLVGRFHGRIYLNLSQCLAILDQVPFVSPETFAELGGLTLAPDLAPRRSWDAVASGRFLARLPGNLFRLARDNMDLERRLAAVEQQVADMVPRLSRARLSLACPSMLGDFLTATDQLLVAAGDLLLTCSANAAGSFLVVQQLVRAWLGADGAGLERALLAGEGELESAKPGIALWHMAQALRHDPQSRAILLETEPERLAVSSFPAGSQIRRDLELFFTAFGYRALREAELFSPRWSEEPAVIFAALRHHLHGRAAFSPREQSLEAGRARRQQAWERIAEQIGPRRRWLLRRLVVVARRYGRLRERLRARVTQVLGFYRELALASGQYLGAPEAAFFLTIDELSDLLGQGAPGREALELNDLWQARRREYELDCQRPDPPPVFRGQPGRAVADGGDGGDLLQGVAASPGQASGTARVLTDHRQAGQFAGEILVVPSADVGWSPLFLVARGLVTELGGVLSHAAVIAREYGVPAVFGVPEATKLIRTGQGVTVDGDRGVVRFER
jgi:pyruvate,water dikinase